MQYLFLNLRTQKIIYIDIDLQPENIQILILSGGKTASTTLYNSFKRINSATFHTHHDEYTNFYLKSKMTIHDIIEAKRKEKLLIISCYREPMYRALSSLFEQHRKLFKIEAETGTEAMNKFIHINNAIIRKKFIEFLKNGEESYHPNQDKGRHLGSYIDIYKFPYNKDQGYQIYETDKFKWIYLRFDKIGNFEKIIRENTKYKNFKLFSTNLTKNKSYYEKYLQAQKFSLPKNVLDLCFKRDEKNLNYFYARDEIKIIKDKWYAQACLEDK